MADFFKVIGTLGWMAGIYMLWNGFGMEPTVTVPGQEPVANMQLLQIQSLAILLGALALVGGTVCLVGGFVLDQVNPPTD